MDKAGPKSWRRAGTILTAFSLYAVTTDGRRFLINAVMEREPISMAVCFTEENSFSRRYAEGPVWISCIRRVKFELENLSIC